MDESVGSPAIGDEPGLGQATSSWPPPTRPLSGPSVTVPESGRPISRVKALRDRATKGVERTEARRLAGVPIATARRFVEIDGKRLASLLTLGLLVAAFPLLILLYAFGSTTAGHGGSLGDALVTQFGITGRAASTVRSTFASASASRQSATVLTILGLVYGGLDIAVVVHTAFARAFRIPPMAGRQRVMRGLLWFVVLVLNLLLTEAIQSNLLDRGIALRVLAIVIQGWLAFAFWLATPRLLLHRRLGAAGLVPMALAGTGITFLTRLASKAWVRHLIDGYVTPFGPFGVILALVSWAIIVTIGWLLVACLGAVLWERFSDPSVVRAVEVAALGDVERRP